MEKTSHWAALYFVTLMTFGNYVLFNLLVAILVEGFSSERHERREREQREIIKAKLNAEQQQFQAQMQMQEQFNEMFPPDDLKSFSESTTSDSYHELKSRWFSAEELRKLNNVDIKCNIQKQRLLQSEPESQPPNQQQFSISKLNIDKDMSQKAAPMRRHQSIKERRNDHRLENIKIHEPPIITTTAATPTDSPNNTLELGASLKDWDQSMDSLDTNVCSRQSSLLSPPSVFGSLKALDDRYLLERVVHVTQRSGGPGSPVSLSVPLCESLSIASKLSNTGSANVLPTCVEQSGDEELEQKQETKLTEPTIIMTAPSPSPSRKTSLKIRRGSSKRKKIATKIEPDKNEILNNGKVINQQSPVGDETRKSSTASDKDMLQLKTNCLKNDTISSMPNNKSPRLSVRRSSSIKSEGLQMGHRHSIFSNKYINHSYYNALNRKNSINIASIQHPHQQHYKYHQRRMSSFENAQSFQHAFEKYSNINMHNFENYMQQNFKADFQKSLSSINNPSSAEQQPPSTSQDVCTGDNKITRLIKRITKSQSFTDERESYSLYIFPETSKFRIGCSWFVNQKWFDNVILVFIALNCITLAMERPNIPPNSTERQFLAAANNVFTFVFAIEMLVKVVAAGMFYGKDAYFTSGWNIMDGALVIISIIDLLMSVLSESSPRIFGILRVFRLLRSLRPLRVINRAPGLKLVVQTLLSSLRPIGNIVLICCTFFIIFGILGVQLFKGTFYYCEGEKIKGVKNKTDCLNIPGNVWINRKYNFDDLGKALMSLFVLSSRDGWVNIMYTGLDAVGVDQQPVVNFNEWRLLYFIAFILLVGFFVLNMFVGVVVENFHRCREEQEKEEKIRRAAKRAIQIEKKRRRMHEPPYYTNYSPLRLFVHNVVTSKYFDLAIAAVIGLNVVTMAMEYYMMPLALEYALKIFNYFFTAVFILEAVMKLVALGVKLYMKDKWNQLDVAIVILSIVGIVLEELETKIIPINPTIIRVMRVLRIARVLKLLKMARGIRALLDTVMQALPQVGNLGLLFFLLFFIFAALGVELFGRLECSDEIPCQGLGEHAHFANFGMAFLTLFRVATGDNWNGIMKDTLRDECDDAADCVKNCCVSSFIAPIFFVIFVLMAQFVLVNVLMRHLEESHKQMEDDLDIETELEREFEREQEFEEDQALCMQLETDKTQIQKRPLTKVSSLPSNFTYSTPTVEKKFNAATRRQTVQYFNQNVMGLSAMNAYNNNSVVSSGASSQPNTICESAENDLDEDTVSKMPIQQQLQQQRLTSRRNLLNKYKTHSFDAKYLTVESAGYTLGPDDFKLSDNINTNLVNNNNNSKDNNKIGQSKVEPIITATTATTSSSPLAGGSSASPAATTINNNLLINKKPINLNSNSNTSSASNRKFNYRQSSLDIDNRRPSAAIQANKYFYDNNNASNNLMISSNNTNNSSLIGTKSYLSVPKLQATSRSRSGSTKQLFKQIALDEDDHTNESSLLLPLQSTAPSTVATTLTVPAQSQIPSVSGLQSSSSSKSVNLSPCDAQISIISSSSSSSSSIPASTPQSQLAHSNSQSRSPPPITMQTLTVDEGIDGNFRKSESCELLRIISERRKV